MVWNGDVENPLKRGLIAAYSDDSDNKEELVERIESEEEKLVNWKKMACLLCWSQSPNKDALVRHQQLSDLHKQNMDTKWRKNSLFNKWCWEIWTATCKKKKPDHQLTLFTKINSRWIKDLNISRDTIKVLEENIGRKISDIPCSNIITAMSPRARDIKERINKWDLNKLKIHFFFFNIIIG